MGNEKFVLCFVIKIEIDGNNLEWLTNEEESLGYYRA
jgi:hypothetical protein